MRLTSDVSGAELADAFALSEMSPALKAGLAEEAEKIAAAARARIDADHPHGTGALSRSIEVTAEEMEEGTAYTIGTARPVGRYLEFGTRRMPAQPWLVPSLREHLPTVKQTVGQILKAVVARIRRR